MGWRGFGGLGASAMLASLSLSQISETWTIISGAYLFFGGLLLLLGEVGEFLLGNTFPTVVFTTFGESSLVATHSRNLTCAASNNCYSWYTATVMVLSGSPLARQLVPSYGAYATYAKDPVRTA
jgi:hypothetical protein